MRQDHIPLSPLLVRNVPDITTREEMPLITKKVSLSSLGRIFSNRQENYSPIVFKHDDEQTCVGRCNEEDNHLKIYAKRDTRSEESVHRDVITNDRQFLNASQKYNEGESELEQEIGQRLGRRGTDKVVKFQKNQNSCHDTEAKRSRVAALYELGKNKIILNRKSVALNSEVDEVTVDIGSIRQSQRIIDLYELGKHRVILNREIAATNLFPVNNLATNVAALSETKASASEIAGRRLFTQAKQSAEKIDKLRQLARETPLPQMELATKQQSHIVSIDRKKYRKVKYHRIATLYDLGKNRVMARRELAANKAKIDTVNIKIGSIRLSQKNCRPLRAW